MEDKPTLKEYLRFRYMRYVKTVGRALLRYSPAEVLLGNLDHCGSDLYNFFYYDANYKFTLAFFCQL